MYLLLRKALSAPANAPLSVLSVLLVVTLAAVSAVRDLSVDVSVDGLLAQEGPIREAYDRALDKFGGDRVTIVYLRDPNLFVPEKLAAVRLAVRRLGELPFVDHVASLFSTKNVKSAEGLVSTKPFFDPIPAGAEAIRQLKLDALRNPLLRKNLIATDGGALAVNIYLKDQDTAPDTVVIAGIEEAIEPLKAQLDSVFQIGPPHIRQIIAKRIHRDQQTLLPLAAVVLLASLLVTLRSRNGALLPLVTATLSVIWTLGFMAAAGIPVNVVTAIVPILLVIIGSTEDVHLLSEYYAGVGRGFNRHRAIRFMAGRMGLAVALTFLTSYLGFLSISANSIALLRQFGLVASTGLLFNFIITVSLVPVWLRFAGETQWGGGRQRFTGWYAALAQSVVDATLANRRVVGTLTVILAVLSVAGILALRVDNEPMRYLAEDSAPVRQASQLHQDLSGIRTLSIVLDSRIEGTFLKVRYLEELRKLQQFLEGTGHFDASFSFADYIAFVHTVIDEEGGETLYLPESDRIVEEYMLFIKPEDVASHVTSDFREARIIVRHDMGSSHELNAAVEQVEAFVSAQVDPGLEVTITGDSVLTAQTADHISKGQARSLALIGAAIFVVVSLLFVNPRAGAIALVPNLFPILMLFGLMGLLGIPLDTGTAMVGAIGIGVCVDYTVHLMVRYNRALRKHKDAEIALRESVRAEATPIMSTALALAAGFAVLAFSSFPPVVYFGLLSAMVMLLALVSNFVLMPVLLSSIKLISLWDILSVRTKAEVLERCALFRGMPKWQIKRLVLASDVRQVRAGDFLSPPGQATKELFLVLSGRVGLIRGQSDGSKNAIATYTAGGVLGEIAPASEVRNPADLVALEDTDVLVLRWDSLRWLWHRYPPVCTQLLLNISAILELRLRQGAPPVRESALHAPISAIPLPRMPDRKPAEYPDVGSELVPIHKLPLSGGRGW